MCIRNSLFAYISNIFITLKEVESIYLATSYIWSEGSRTCNEDSMALLRIHVGRKTYLFAAVADGIGGLASGEVASAVVIRNLRHVFEQTTKRGGHIGLERLSRYICRELYRTHVSLTEYGADVGRPMGTTITVAVMCNRRGRIIHIGDSTCYRMSIYSRRVKKLVKIAHDQFGRLTQSIGYGSYHRPYRKSFFLNKFSILVLCTDGIYKRMHSRDWFRIYESVGRDISKYSEALADYVYRKGEKDNATAICISGREYKA